MRMLGGKWRLAVLLIAAAGVMTGLAGCEDESMTGTYRADYTGTSEYDKLMYKAIQEGDIRYMPESHMPDRNNW